MRRRGDGQIGWLIGVRRASSWAPGQNGREPAEREAGSWQTHQQAPWRGSRTPRSSSQNPPKIWLFEDGSCVPPRSVRWLDRAALLTFGDILRGRVTACLPAGRHLGGVVELDLWYVGIPAEDALAVALSGIGPLDAHDHLWLFDITCKLNEAESVGSLMTGRGSSQLDGRLAQPGRARTGRKPR